MWPETRAQPPRANTARFRLPSPDRRASKHASLLVSSWFPKTSRAAGGKTEAAFFPALSMMDSQDWRPVSVLYLSPIRALLNNQEQRVSRYAGMLGRRAFKWHGDVTASQRKKFISDPTDILLTTPESVEAMLMSSRVPTRQLFEGLRLVIIDEIHAFADDDRGAHLVSLLERLSRFCGKDLQRVGLSATVGNPEEILRWVQGSSRRASVIVNPGGAKKAPDLALDFVGTFENAARMIQALHPGQKRLVFVDSRAKAEKLGALLNTREVITYVSHGSLSLTARRDAETAFEQGQDCVIVATSTLELGIDVGDLDRVLQIESPPTVASFLQRMGRTGRRGGPPNCTFLTVSQEGVLQAAAVLQLFREGYVEPVAPSLASYHILAQQLMALTVQTGGVASGDWFEWLRGATVFERVSSEDREALVAHMLKEEILATDGARLFLGPKGEKKYGYGNFRELYAVFDSPRLVTVMSGSVDLGTVDANFLAALSSEQDLGSFTLGARHWQIVHINWEQSTCQVIPAESGKAPRWFGSGNFLSYDLCQCMRRVLGSTDLDPAWSKRMQDAIIELRGEYAFVGDSTTPLIDHGRHIEWWTFAGGSANVLLARLLEAELGSRVTARNTSIVFKEEAAQSVSAVRDALRKLSAEGRPTAEDALAYADGPSRKRLSKFELCVPEPLLLRLLAERTMDVVGAQRALEALR